MPAVNVGTTVDSFVTPGFATSLSSIALLTDMDGTGATSAQMDAFINNMAGVPGGILSNATVNASQFVTLNNAAMFTPAVGIVPAGAISIDATAATPAQVAAILAATVVAAPNNVVAASAIDNLQLTGAQATGGAGVIDYAKIATDGADINAADTVAANSVGLINTVAANVAKIGVVTNVALNNAGIAAPTFGSFATTVAPQGITSTTAAGFAAADWTTLVANRALFAVNSITNAGNTLSLANFTTIPNKFANGGVLALSFATATDPQITSVIANASKIAANAITSATLDPADFSSLASKIANGQATVDASTATPSEMNTILNYLAKFNHTLSNVDLTVAQFNQTAGNGAALSNALVQTGTGALQVTAAASTVAVTMDGSGYTGNLSVVGSEYSDSFSLGGGNDILQGGKGSDAITGGAGNDSLSGGNAADTITGGAGNDTITGGKSIAQQFFTGDTALLGGGTDTFIMNGGNNVITDLGGVAGGDADVLTNAAVVDTSVTTVANDVVAWTATSASNNAGALTINAAAAGGNINLAAMTATVGATVVGGAGVDVIVGSTQSDSLRGGAGNDVITGGRGSNTMVGGTGDDIFNVSAGATDTITDLSTTAGVSDRLVNNGTVVATATTSWTAQGAVGPLVATTNNGVATVNAGNGFNLDARLAAGTGGWTLSANGNSAASLLLGSLNADTLIGGSAGDILNGHDGADSLNGGLGNDTLTGDDTATPGPAAVDTFNIGAGTDTVTDLGFGGLADVLIVSGSANANISVVGNYTAGLLNSNTSTGIVTLTDATVAGTATINMANAAGTGGYTLVGGNGAAGNVLTGSANADIINGGGGTDTIVGGAGNDTILGGAAADTITGGAGADNMNGETGADTFVIAANTDVVAGEVINGGDIVTANDILQAVTGSLNLGVATVSNIQTLNLAAGLLTNEAYVIGQGFSTGAALTVNGFDGGAGTDTFTINHGTTSFNATATGGAVTAAGQWNVAAGVITYWDEVSASAVAVTLTGSAGNVGSVNAAGNLVYTA